MKTLHLLPNILHPASTWKFTPPPIQALIAESEKGAYAYFKHFSVPKVPVHLLNEHTKNPLELLKIAQDEVGLISDAGLPCLADPGSQLVLAARKAGISVQAYPGPSSILLALMLSGLPGQQFFFHGYLEREEKALERQIQQFAPGVTHLFIEAPYRNQKLYETILRTLKASDLLCIASDLTSPEEWIQTTPISAWKTQPVPNIHKKPAILLIFKS
ncbi:MAG: SAM-dependent methyltransferase [Verrucomicrobia bacterium]|nr:SAM-dependent methyltransferase [Verrucomicrobiota bacterium]